MKIIEFVLKEGTFRYGKKGDGVKLIQDALRKAGHELVVDGDYGNITQQAVERFQAAARIAADGMVGPITATYLDAVKLDSPPTAPLPSVIAVAPWLSTMRALTGTKEIPGARSNPLILSWVKVLCARYPDLQRDLAWYMDDDTPWCGLGVAWVLGSNGHHPVTGPLRALNWAQYDKELPFGIPGAIGVKARKGGGHVTLYESEFGGKVYCRGANQDNQINVGEYNKGDFISWRWPRGAAMPKLEPLVRRYVESATVTEA